jgi:hypothetical protein
MLGGMDNSHRDSADQFPTQQIWPAAGSGGSGGRGPNSPDSWGQNAWGAGPAGPTPPGSNPPGTGPAGPTPPGRGPRRLGRATRWGAGLAAVAVLAGGGVALASAGHPAGPSAQATGAGAQVTGPSGQAATLNTVLSSADSPTSADAAAAAPVPSQASSARPRAAACARAAAVLRAAHRKVIAHRVRAACRGRLARLRLVRGIHGEFTFQAKKGGAKTLAFERGTVSSVTSSSVTVAASDGTTWTWHLVGSTVVRMGGKKVSAGSLADGQRVFAGGPVVSGADNARLIVIRPAAHGGAPAS